MYQQYFRSTVRYSVEVGHPLAREKAGLEPAIAPVQKRKEKGRHNDVV